MASVFTSSLLSQAADSLHNRIVFTHTDTTLVVVFGPFVEFRPVGENTTTFLDISRQALIDSLIAAELAKDLALILANGSLATGITTVYAVLSDVQAALRAAYQAATRVDAIMLGDYLSSLTNAQLQTLFAMTSAQVTTLRTNKLTPAASAATTIRAAAGQ